MFRTGKTEEVQENIRWISNFFVIIGLVMSFCGIVGWLVTSSHARIDLPGIDLPIWGWVIAIPVVLFVILDLIFDKKSRGIRHFCVGGLMLVWNVYVYVAELNEPTKSIFRGSPTGLFVMTLVASLLIITAGVLRMRDRHKQ
jgi:hypothetical protein